MAHLPTIAATTALAAFVVAGALIHAGTSPAAFGVTVATPGGVAAAAAAPWATPGDGAQMAPQKTLAGGPGNPDRMAMAGSGADSHQPPPPGLAASQAPPTATLQRTGSGLAGATGDVAEVKGLPDGGALSGLRPPVPVTAAPLPPVPLQAPQPPLAPVPPGVAGADTARASAMAAPVPPAVPQPAAPGVPARMAVAMPLSIPALGPLDPARINGAARELAEAVHLLASQAGSRALAAERAAAGARKQSGGCPRETGPRPVSLRDSLCDKAGL